MLRPEGGWELRPRPGLCHLAGLDLRSRSEAGGGRAVGTGRTLVSSPQVWQLLREASPCWRLKQEPWGGDEVQERGARGFLCPRVAPTPAKGTALGSGSMGHLKLPKPRKSPGVPSCCQQPCTALPWDPGLHPSGSLQTQASVMGLGDPVPDLGALVRQRRVSGACTRATEDVGPWSWAGCDCRQAGQVSTSFGNVSSRGPAQERC